MTQNKCFPVTPVTSTISQVVFYPKKNDTLFLFLSKAYIQIKNTYNESKKKNKMHCLSSLFFRQKMKTSRTQWMYQGNKWHIFCLISNSCIEIKNIYIMNIKRRKMYCLINLF